MISILVGNIVGPLLVSDAGMRGEEGAGSLRVLPEQVMDKDAMWRLHRTGTGPQ
ncbi:hypothetical protein NicSoilB8_04950 [Arthrobacter sp. NicSoilB8]|nr:hypothetical protein NicSoilB8_04950 [Arthrobacter sp. NicSoilB8]